METITRLTTKYNVEEDRLQLNADLDGGSPTVLWVTQRLANALFSTLAGWLDRTVDAGRWERDTHLGWEHSAAQSRQVPVEPVAAVNSDQRLIHTIDLQQYEGAFRLVLHAKPDFAATVAFDDTQMHQWLGIVHRLYREAGWPDGFWPRWLSQPLAAATDGDSRIVH